MKAADAVSRAASSAGDNSFGSDGGGGPDHALERVKERKKKKTRKRKEKM